MSNCNKKLVIDALGLYRLNAVDVLCCKESLDAFKANNDFAIEFGKLFEFLVNTKLTKMSLTKRISYRAFVYVRISLPPNCNIIHWRDFYNFRFILRHIKSSLWIKPYTKKLFHIHRNSMNRALSQIWNYIMQILIGNLFRIVFTKCISNMYSAILLKMLQKRIH